MTGEWYRYTEYAGRHTVAGDVRVQPAVWSPQLRNRRDILVYLPPSYADSTRRYPVVYMHDGQNLFDETTSFAGEWGADETMERLSAEGIEAIVVGVPNAGELRLDEYGPFHNGSHGGGGTLYLSFLAETLKPLIDAAFRTRVDREATGLMGSSMGGLISLYGFFHRPETFGFAGVMSPSLWFAGASIFGYVEGQRLTPGRIYLDAGLQEGPKLRGRPKAGQPQLRRMAADARRMEQLLAAKGYTPGVDLLYVEDQEGHHSEESWGRRLPQALRFLLGRPEAAI